MVYIILFALGAAWGSFLNVAACRIQERRSFVRGRSVCVRCGTVLHWHDLIPVASWLLLWGRCRYCRKHFSVQYLASELAVGGLFVLGAFVVATPIHALLYLAVVSFCTVLFIYDVRTYIVPDKIVIPAIAAIGALNFIIAEDGASLVVGALFGAAWFLAQFLVSRGRWVGGGDIRLGALLGVLLGHPMVWLGLGLAYVGGSVVSLALVATTRITLKSRLPFAAFLLPAAFAAWVFGDAVWGWYARFIGL